jgi:hypothetical protein
VNKLLAASATSKTSLGQFAPAASMAAQTVSKIGGSDEELLAATAHMTKATKSPEVAGTQINSLATALIKKGMTSKGLFGAVEEIQSKGMSAKQLQKFFGRTEAFKGFESMVKLMPEMKSTEADLRSVQRKGEGRDLVSGMQRTYRSDPRLQWYRQEKIAKQREKMASENAGVEQMQRETAVSNYRTISKQSGEPAIGRLLNTAAMEIMGFMGASPQGMAKGALSGPQSQAYLGYTLEGDRPKDIDVTVTLRDRRQATVAEDAHTE